MKKANRGWYRLLSTVLVATTVLLSSAPKAYASEYEDILVMDEDSGSEEISEISSDIISDDFPEGDFFELSNDDLENDVIEPETDVSADFQEDTRYTVTFNTGKLTYAPRETDCGLVVENGKFYLEEDAVYFQLSFSCPYDYEIDEAASTVVVEANGKKYTYDAVKTNRLSIRYDDDSDIYEVVFPYDYTSQEGFIIGNTTVNLVTTSCVSKYTVTCNKEVVINQADLDRFSDIALSGGKYYVKKNAESVSLTLKAATGYMPAYDENGGLIYKVTVGGKVCEDCLYYYEDDRKFDLDVDFDYDDDYNTIQANIVINITMAPLSRCKTFTFDSKLTPINEEDDWLGFVGNVKTTYYIAPNASDISSSFSISKEYLVELGEDGYYLADVTFGGKKLAQEYYTVEYDDNKSTISFHADFPCDDEGNTLKGSIVFKPKLLTRKTSYVFSYSGGAAGLIKIEPDYMADNCGLIYSGGKYFVERGADSVDAIFSLAKGYMFDVDAEGNYKISVSIGDKKLPSDSYNLDTQPYLVSKSGKDDAPETDGANAPKYFGITINRFDEEGNELKGNISFTIKCVKTRTDYTLSFGNNLYVTPENIESMTGLEYENGKFYVERYADYISITFTIAEGYGADRSKDSVQGKVTYGGKALSEDDFAASSFSNTSMDLSVYFPLDKNSNVVYGNIVFTPYLEKLVKVAFTYDETQVEVENYIYEEFISKDKKLLYGFSGEDFTFRVTPKEGYKVNSITCGSTSLDAEETTHTIENLKADTTVSIESSLLPDVNFIANTKGATVTYTGVVTDSAGNMKTNHCEIVAKVSVPKGKEIKKVTYQIGSTVFTLYPDDETGEYVITEDYVLFAIELQKDILFTVTVEASKVRVLTVVNDKTNPKTNPITFTGGVVYDSSQGCYVTADPETVKDSAISFTIKKASDEIISSVAYTVAGQKAVALKPDSKGIYQIPSNTVVNAVSEGWDITISLAISSQTFTIKVDNPAGVVFKTYSMGGTVGSTVATQTVGYKASLTFTALLDKKSSDRYKITDVLCDGVSMESKEDGPFSYYVLKDITADHVLKAVVEPIATYVTIKVTPDSGVKSFTASCGGRYLASSGKSGSTYIYEVPVKSSLAFNVTSADNFALAAPTAANGTKATVKGNVITLTAGVDEDIKISTRGITRVVLTKGSSSDSYADKASATMTTSEEYKVQIKEGNTALDISGVSLKNGPKSEGFAVPNAADKSVRFVGKEAVGVNKTITATITATSLAGKKVTKTVNLTVLQSAASVSLKGFTKGSAKQAVGTSACYAVTLNTNANYSDVTASLVSGSDSNCQVTYDAAAKALKVDTFKGSTLTALDKQIIVQFKNKKGEAIGDKFVITPVAGSLAAPVAKCSFTTDKEISLKLSAPAAVSGYKNLHYKVVATAVTTKKAPLAANMVAKYTKYLPVSTTTHTFSMYAGSGAGSPQKYKVEVTLVQSKAGTIKDEAIVSASKATVVNAATKASAYEKKLTLTKKTTAFTLYEKNVQVATAKFSATTTVNKLAKAEIMEPGTGKVYDTRNNAGVIALTDNATSVVIKDSASLIPGAYTLKAYPVAEGNTEGAPASMQFTVKAPVTGITFAPIATRYYKVGGKALSFKISASCMSFVKNKEYKPASTKVNWTIESSNAALAKAVKVNAGTVTVDKSYMVSGDASQNQFYVVATAADLGTNSKAAIMKLAITLSGDKIVPRYVYINGVNNLSAPHSLGEISGKQITVSNSYLEKIDPKFLTYSVAPKSGLTVSSAGKITVSKPGTYTITITANDGSGSKCVQKIVIAGEKGKK